MAFESLHVRLGVEPMSGDQLVYKTIAPMAFVEDFAGGKYVSYTVTGIERFRLIELPSKDGNVKG
eukprot:SAG11_NODE_34689_length_270_cov_1.204678_1_plen_64_part_01